MTAGSAWAQRNPRSQGQAEATEEKPGAPSEKFPAPPAEEKTVKTQHVIHVNGQELHYTAIAGTLLLSKDDGKPKASIFYVSYALDGADKTKRPITFAFNGGPGSSSVWLHMGALGPKRVALTPDGQAVPPPYHLVDNEGTALVFSDIVFIDPVTTGFSRNAPGEDPKQFHGLEGDLAEVGDFIRLYTTRYGRWTSPKFLAGESYGTTRASALSLYLLENEGIYLNGITLISSILNFETARFAPGNDLPYILFLPTYTAAAWYHKKLSGDLQTGDLQHVTEEARKFAGGPYKDALMKGDQLSETERKEVAQQVARFTGLPAEYVEEANLRISISRFTKALMRNEMKTVGRYDSRLEGVDADAAGERPEYDPSYAAVQGAFTAAFNEYVRSDLNWQTDMPYEVLTAKVQPWNYSNFTNQYVNVAERLRSAMSQNPFMRVLQMNGYYDLATPFFATEYTFEHLGLEPKLRDNVTMHYCDAGHMLYLKQSCLEELHRDMAQMYQGAVTTGR
ncbi:MAG: peptidase S10 [Acidobacteriaceae bacterium]|nr:peptidase S10 [Acidobacteriaceae bacterium]